MPGTTGTGTQSQARPPANRHYPRHPSPKCLSDDWLNIQCASAAAPASSYLADGHHCAQCRRAAAATSDSADHATGSADYINVAVIPADTAANAPLPVATNHSAHTAASTSTAALPPTPANAATSAISSRAADLAVISKCIKVWSQTANGDFRYTNPSVVPANTASDALLPLATSRSANAAASASTTALPPAAANATSSTGHSGANNAASEFCRTFSQTANDDFRRQWGASPAASTGTAASCIADGAASSTAPIPIPPSSTTSPANIGQLAAHAAAKAVTAAAYATAAARTVGVCFNPNAEFGSLHNAAISSIEALVWATAQAAINIHVRPPQPLPDSPPSKRPRPPASVPPSNKARQRPASQPALPDLVVSPSGLVQSLFVSSRTLLAAADLVETLSIQAG